MRHNDQIPAAKAGRKDVVGQSFRSRCDIEASKERLRLPASRLDAFSRWILRADTATECQGELIFDFLIFSNVV